MSDLARHQKLERILGAGIAAEIDKALVDNLRACLRGDIAAQIDVQLARNLEVVRGPSIAHGVEQIDTAAAGNGNQGIDLGIFANRFQWL